jgi:N-acetylmuramoyl-L-alanine amidase
MRKALLHLSFLAAALLPASFAEAEPFLRIVQPYENASLSPVKQSFVFGSVLPATATLTINGLPVKPYANGGFLAMIPLEPGRFKVEAVADDGVSSTTVIRYINVAAEPAPFSEKHKSITVMAPRGRRVVRAGDVIDLAIQGAPGGEAQFKFPGGDFLRLEEQGRVPGIYRGSYTIRPGDKFDKGDVTFSLKRKDGKKITEKAGAEIIVQRRETPRVVELKEDAVLLTGPDNDFGYNLFSLPGVRFEVTGEQADFVRIAVGADNEGWVRKSSVIELPAGTQLPRSISRNIRVWTDGSSTFVEVPLQHRHLHRMEQTLDPHTLHLTLYGVTADTDRMRYASVDTVVRDITWFQPKPETFTLEIRTRQKLAWGYEARYENNTMVLEIRHKPKITGKAPGGKLPSMRGVKVALDAGHSTQSFGTIGPWGNTEAAVNLAAAKVIRAELERRGAEVVMVQDGTREISLPDRVATAWRSKAQFFLSIHCDAVPEGVDPRESEGYSVHYFHPQSQPFAEGLHKNYGALTKVRDAGLWRSNLAVCRTSTMPSVLLEMGFLILPEQEEILLSAKHQKRVAEAVASTIRDLVLRSEP